MHKNALFVIFIFLILSITSGCNENIEFANEGPFIILTDTPGGENYYVEFYPRNIEVHNDGTIRIYTENTDDIIVEEDAPIVNMQLTDKEVEGIKETIEKNHFLTLDKDVSDPGVMDGPMQYVTVYTKTESRKVGGEWPVDENFQAIREVILDYVWDEYNQWLADIDEYIYEKNPGPSD